MIEDDSNEEIEVVLTKRMIAALQDKARLSREGWEEFARRDESPDSRIPEPYRGQSRDRATLWARIEQRFAQVMSHHDAKKQRKLATRRL